MKTPGERCSLLGEDVARHSGAPCDDPACPFRRPLNIRSRALAAVPDLLAEAIAEFRREMAAPRPRPRPDVAAKATHVREAAKSQERAHFCHVPSCREPCPPAWLMCTPHWQLVPRKLQRAVWTHYQVGQERGEVEPTAAYQLAADAAIAAVERILHPPQGDLFK